jgi:hypothetical protein
MHPGRHWPLGRDASGFSSRSVIRRSRAFADLILIVVLSLIGSFTASIILSFAAVLSLDYFFTEPAPVSTWIFGTEHGELAAIQGPDKECSELHLAAHQRQTLVFARSTTSSARPPITAFTM